MKRGKEMDRFEYLLEINEKYGNTDREMAEIVLEDYKGFKGRAIVYE